MSVIMPAYNAAAFVAEAVESVLTQSLTDWQLIVVDDGSTDATQAILAAFDDPRIRVIRQANSGVSVARNTALDASTGIYVTFLDADDTIPPDALACRTAYLDANPAVDIATGAVRITRDGATERVYKPDVAVGAFLPRLAKLDESVVPPGCSYMLRRAKIGAHRFPTGISHAEDLIFFMELAHDAGLVYGGIEDEVCEYRRHANSAMTNVAGIEAGYIEFLRRATKLRAITPVAMRHLTTRIASIMLKTWVRRGRPDLAARTLFKIIMAGRHQVRTTFEAESAQ